MRRLVIAALAGIGLLGLGSLAFIGLAPTGGPTMSDAGPAPVEPVARTAPDGVAPPPRPTIPGSTASLVPPGWTPSITLGGTPPPPPPDSWEAIPPVARAARLGRAGAAIAQELNELNPRLASCFEQDAQQRHAQEGHTTIQDTSALEDGAGTVLILQVEVRAGEARIVDAPVSTYGGASDAVVACAQRILRGHSIPVADPKPGRYRILFPLAP
jgi:hypothetical protein